MLGYHIIDLQNLILKGFGIGRSFVVVDDCKSAFVNLTSELLVVFILGIRQFLDQMSLESSDFKFHLANAEMLNEDLVSEGLNRDISVFPFHAKFCILERKVLSLEGRVDVAHGSF